MKAMVSFLPLVDLNANEPRLCLWCEIVPLNHCNLNLLRYFDNNNGHRQLARVHHNRQPIWLSTPFECIHFPYGTCIHNDHSSSNLCCYACMCVCVCVQVCQFKPKINNMSKWLSNDKLFAPYHETCFLCHTSFMNERTINVVNTCFDSEDNTHRHKLCYVFYM